MIKRLLSFTALVALAAGLSSVPAFAGAVVTTVTTPAGASNTAGGIILDEEGRIYSADFGGTALYRVELDGSTTVFANGFKTPSGNNFDSRGRLYQSNYNDPAAPGANDTVSRVDRQGRVTTFARNMNGPVGIAVAEDGTLFVVQCDGNNVARVSAEGEVSIFASGPLFVCPNGIAFDDRGVLFAVNFNDGALLKITPDGAVSRIGTSPGGGSGHITYVAGGLYITDRLGNQIHRFDVRNGRLTESFGSGSPGNADGPEGAATFNQPNGIARNAEGSALFTNEAGNVIRRIELDLARPKRVKKVRVKVTGPSEAELTWKHPSRNKEGFTLEIRQASGEFEVAGTVSSTALGAALADLEPGTTYTVRVTAFNGTAASRASKRVTFTTDP